MLPPVLTTVYGHPARRPKGPQPASVRFGVRQPSDDNKKSEAERGDSFNRLGEHFPALGETAPGLDRTVSVPALGGDSIPFLRVVADFQHRKAKSGWVGDNLDPNLKNLAGDTLLMHAVVRDDVQAVQALIDAGADVNLKNETHQGLSALSLGILAGSRDAVDILLRTPNLDVNTVDNEKCSALTYAVGAGRHGILKKLLDRGADPNQADNEGTTPLALACQNKNLQAVSLLLEAGANADQPDQRGDTPLLLAVARGNQPIVQLLLAANADPNHQNQKGFSPLSAAIARQCRILSDILLRHGADINRLDDSGQTLLTRLSRKAALSHVNFALLLGADVNQPDADGISPLRHAILARRPEVVERLLNHPRLAELPDIRRALLPLSGQSNLTPEDLKKLAYTLTSFLIAEPLGRNPEISLADLFRGLRKTSQALRSSPSIQRFKRQNPDEYQKASLSILVGLEEGDASAESVFSSLREGARQALESRPAQSSPTAPPLRAGHPIVNGFVFNTRTVQRNLEIQLRELGRVRPDCRDQMRLNILHQLFESHETVERLRQTDASGYLLACQAFLGLTSVFFQGFEENPGLLENWSQDRLERAYRGEVTEALRRGRLSGAYNAEILASMLTRPTR